MCGRFVRSFTVSELIEEMNIAVPSLIVADHIRDELAPEYNVPPSVQIPTVSIYDNEVHLEQMRWGFKLGESTQLVINARAESVTEKPMFKHLLASQRCAIPMDGFFEWQREEKRKTPFYVQREDSRIMWVAGLWRQSSDGAKQVVLLTHEAEGALSAVHHRSPCQLTVDDAMDWALDNEPHFGLLTPDAGPALQLHQVSRNVNSIRNNDPSLLEPVEIRDEDEEVQLNLFD